MSATGRILADMLREQYKTDGTPTSKLSDIFEREPVPLTTFITDSKYLKYPRMSDIQFDFVRNLEQIYYPETYIAMVEQFGPEWAMLPMKNMLVAQWGKGAGKDMVCRYGVTRAADLLMCLKSPQDYFGLPAQDSIHLINVAASGDQAKRAFFSPMRQLFLNNKHLGQYFAGDAIPSPQAISINLKKNVELISGHSMADTQEGLNILVGIADEISAFKTEDEIKRAGRAIEGREGKTAEGIVNMLRTSAASRFSRTFKIAQISYPRFKGDAIQMATETALKSIQDYGSSSRYYVTGPFASWDVNPRLEGKADFQFHYDEDPEVAAAMYECRPSAAVNRFMRNDVAIEAAFSRMIADPVTVEYFWGLPDVATVEHAQAPQERQGWQVRFRFNESLVPMAGAAYALHGDLALRQDRAGIAMSHVRAWKETDPRPGSETTEPRPVIKNDFTFSFQADVAAVRPDGEIAAREVQIRWYRQLVWELYARGFNIASVTFDGFQSEDMIQILESRGIESGRLSLDRNAKVYETFKDTIYDGRLEGYWRLLLKNEVEGLRMLPNGKVDHPPNGSKDESDALAGSVWGAIEVGGDEGQEPESLLEASPFAFVTARSQASMAQLSFGGAPGGGIDYEMISNLNELNFGNFSGMP